MVWAKLDDGILDHPKIARAGFLGYAWFTAGLIYCNRNLTDGFIPYGVARQLALMVHTDDEGRVWRMAATSGMAGYDGEELVEKLIEWLVAAGLWEEVDGGYRVHDFHDWNPTKDAVQKERMAKSMAKSMAGKKGAEARWGSKPIADAWQSDGPVPVPVPEPVPVTSTAPTANAEVKPTEDELYLLRRLFEADSNWSSVTPGAIVKLNKQYGRHVVHQALQHLRESPPGHVNSSAFGLLEAACSEVSA